MKVLDVMYVHKWYKTREELLEEIQQTGKVAIKLPDFDAMLNSEKLHKAGRNGRIVAEDAIKLRAMRETRFGKQGERVPSQDTSRVPSVPLSCSTAQPTKDVNDIIQREVTHVLGQKLHGNMIPRQTE